MVPYEIAVRWLKIAKMVLDFPSLVEMKLEFPILLWVPIQPPCCRIVTTHYMITDLLIDMTI